MVDLSTKIVAIDTMILVYLFEDKTDLAPLAENILNKSGWIIASIIAHLEVATGFYKNDDLDNLNHLTRLDDFFDNFSFVPVNMDISLESARLRAKYPFLKTPDSIHLATGIIKKADFFITDDKRLKKIQEKGIKIITLTEV